MDDVAARALPAWGRRGRRVGRIAVHVIVTLIALGWFARLVDAVADTSIRDSDMFWFVQAVFVASVLVGVVGGLIWLAGEFVAGLRTPRRET